MSKKGVVETAMGVSSLCFILGIAGLFDKDTSFALPLILTSFFILAQAVVFCLVNLNSILSKDN